MNKKFGFALLALLVIMSVSVGIYMYKKKSAPVISFEKQDGATYWSGNGSGDYTCPQAEGVQLNGDLANYCIFYDEASAQKWCAKDPECIGYVNMDNSSLFQCTKRTAPGGGNFYKKVEK